MNHMKTSITSVFLITNTWAIHAYKWPTTDGTRTKINTKLVFVYLMQSKYELWIQATILHSRFCTMFTRHRTHVRDYIAFLIGNTITMFGFGHWMGNYSIFFILFEPTVLILASKVFYNNCKGAPSFDSNTNHPTIAGPQKLSFWILLNGCIFDIKSIFVCHQCACPSKVPGAHLLFEMQVKQGINELEKFLHTNKCL